MNENKLETKAYYFNVLRISIDKLSKALSTFSFNFAEVSKYFTSKSFSLLSTISWPTSLLRSVLFPTIT